MEESRKVERALVLPVADSVILPGVKAVMPLQNGGGELLEKLEKQEETMVALPLRQNFRQEAVKSEDFHRIGVLFTVEKLQNTEKGTFLHAEFGDRVSVSALNFEDGVFYAGYEPYPELDDLDARSQEEILAYYREIVRTITENFQNGSQYVKLLDNFQDINMMIAYLGRYLHISGERKYEYLKTDSIKERSLLFMDDLLKQKENVKLSMELNEKVSDRANRVYRNQVLREQLKSIQEELNESEGGGSRRKNKKDYRERIEEAELPEEIREAALEEADRLEALGQGSAEESVIRNYLDFILALPWKKEEEASVNLEEARQILEADHYGLEKVKERILQYLAVLQLKKGSKGSILLLAGPPGTGKTSLGRSIARALDRKYIRLSLGGIRDEAEIRGHRRTYVGALPGRILQSIKTAGVTNPVMVLDEVDKLMSGGYSGDPASALLEVLDPEQNSTFTDHYLDLPYDLSDVFFIATANSTDTIPGPLMDRMEVIQVSGYTEEEKFHIAREHLIPEVREEHGLSEEQFRFEDDALRKIITDYTLEAGVRGLKKQLAAVARAVSEKIVMHKDDEQRAIRPEDLEELLGRQVSRHDRAQEDNPPGVVTGLAWTPVGGEILFIEATDMPGSGQVILTGQLGDVMKESARISLSLLKSRLPLDTGNLSDRDIHIHVPSGAVSKDGPSAGIALFTALASLFTGRKVDPHLAMTGEITLRGAVLPIGGLKEKLLGAQRAGITKALIPADNVADLKELPEELTKQMNIIPVATVEDVLRETLGISLPRIEHIYLKNLAGAAGEGNFGKV